MKDIQSSSFLCRFGEKKKGKAMPILQTHIVPHMCKHFTVMNVLRQIHQLSCTFPSSITITFHSTTRCDLYLCFKKIVYWMKPDSAEISDMPAWNMYKTADIMKCELECVWLRSFRRNEKEKKITLSESWHAFLIHKELFFLRLSFFLTSCDRENVSSPLLLWYFFIFSTPPASMHFWCTEFVTLMLIYSSV